MKINRSKMEAAIILTKMTEIHNKRIELSKITQLLHAAEIIDCQEREIHRIANSVERNAEQSHIITQESDTDLDISELSEHDTCSEAKTRSKRPQYRPSLSF